MKKIDKSGKIKYWEYFSDTQKEIIFDIVGMVHKWPNKTELVEIANKGLKEGEKIKMRNFDTSYPSPYMDRIAEIFPNIRKGEFIFDYSEKSFGELKNVNDLFMLSMLRRLRESK